MKKRVLAFLVIIAIVLTYVPSAVFATTTAPEIKNVIFLIPDGGGYGPYDFANLVKQAGGFDSTKFPYKTPTDTNPMTLGDYLVGSVITDEYDSTVTDSAAAGTALATGKKTASGYLASTTNGKPLATLLEGAQSLGKSTGLIATYEWMHATPAAFSSHSLSRNDYYNIYQQMENKGIDVVLGAGYGAVSDYATIQNAVDRGYTVIDTEEELKAVKPGDKIWGNLADVSLPYDINLSSTQPTLAEMTEAAITALSDNENGFFLMVEGSKVDSGGHSNDAVVTTSEYLAFDAAFKVALDYAKDRNDTIVVATPDHDTGGLIVPDDPAEAIELTKQGTDPAAVKWEDTSHTGQNVGLWIYAPEGIELMDGVSKTPGDTSSTRTDYVVDNTVIAPWIANLIGVDLAALTEELFVDVTRVGVYDPNARRFTFNNTENGVKYVDTNQSHYYQNGEKKSMGHAEMIYLKGRVYVPSSIVEDGDLDAVGGYDGLLGSGMINDPYIIADEYDFIEFTDDIIMGETYSGKYFKQTEDIDMSLIPSYTGVGKEGTFAGVYDGNGHKINVNMVTTSDKCIFPYVDGTIMNLGTTGVISGGSSKGGIARSLRAGSKMANCYSTVELKSSIAAGLSWSYSSSAKMSNCYFAGKLTGTTKYAISSQTSRTFENCYYLEDCGATQTSTGVTQISATDYTTTLAQTLETGREAAATTTKIDVNTLAHWKKSESGAPVMFYQIPTVTGVTVTPEAVTVNKGDGVLLSATVEGEYNPSKEVVWSIEPMSEFEGTYIESDGYLVIDPNETMTSFIVLAKSAIDGGVGDACSVTVGSETFTEPDGSRARPYLIWDEDDFAEFTAGLIANKTYSGKYFKQMADIDMTGYEGYTGVGDNETFAGIYDGNGYTINVDITSTSDKCIFPYVEGTLLNVGTTGKITGGTYIGGISRSIRATGKMINCWSTVDLTCANLGGLTWTNKGTIMNCYFAGTRTATDLNYALMSSTTGSKYNYYLGSKYSGSESQTQVTQEQLETDLVKWLNTGVEYAVSECGLATSQVKTWVAVKGKGPEHYRDAIEAAATLSNVVYSNGVITGNIDFSVCTGKCNAYVVLYRDSDKAMVSITKEKIKANTGLEGFELGCGQLGNEAYTVVLLLWDGTVRNHAAPVSMPLEK